MTDGLAWMVAADTNMVASVKPDGSKHLMTLADVICQLTRDRGITEVRLVDHNLRPKTKDSTHVTKNTWFQRLG